MEIQTLYPLYIQLCKVLVQVSKKIFPIFFNGQPWLMFKTSNLVFQMLQLLHFQMLLDS